MIRRKWNSSLLSCLVALAAATLLPLAAGAQVVTSNQVDVSLTATAEASIEVEVSPTAVDFSPLDVFGVTAGSPQLSVTTTWNLPFSFDLVTCAYFDSATAALTDTGGLSNDIPSSDVEGSLDGGFFSAFTDSCNLGTGLLGVPGASIVLFFNFPADGPPAGSNTRTLDLRIDRTGDPVLPPGNYAGTLHIIAGAQ